MQQVIPRGDVPSDTTEPSYDELLSATDCLAEGERLLENGSALEGLRYFGIALLLEPGHPRGRLGAALALDALGEDKRARDLLLADSLVEQLPNESLLRAISLAGRRGWREIAVPFLAHSYLQRPTGEDLAQLNELATVVLDQVAPELAAYMPRQVRPAQRPKVRRNDPCPCGSGRKYKHCCLKKEQALPSQESRGEADNLSIIATIREEATAWEVAAEIWERLVDRYSDVPAYWHHLGRCRFALKQFRPALAAFERLERFPEYQEATEEWAHALTRAGRRREAMRVLDRNPHFTFASASASALRAEVLTQLGRPQEARDDLLRAHHLAPAHVEYLVSLAETCQLIGDRDGAVDAAERALNLTTPVEAGTPPTENDLELRVSAAAVLAGLGQQPERVLRVCDDVLSRQPESDLKLQTLAVRAHVLLMLGRPGSAAAVVEEALKIGEALELFLIGAAAASQMEYTQARVSFLREAVRSIEDDQNAEGDEVGIGGLIAAILGEYERALALADRALGMNPDSEIAIPVRAHCLLMLDRAQEALATTRTRRSNELSSPLLILTRGDALCRLGRHQESLTELAGLLPVDKGPFAPLLSQLQEVQPQDRQEMLRGRALWRLGRAIEALDALRSLVKRSPRYADAWVEMALCHLDEGDAQSAHRALLEAERLNPGQALVREKLAYVEGMLWGAQKERNEAERAIRRLIGNEAWLSLGSEGRLALSSSEVTRRQTRGIEDEADYGPVVAQLARAVELEMLRRLFGPFREYAVRVVGRDWIWQATSEEDANSQLFPFHRFLRTPQGGLSLGPMLAAIDEMLAGSGGQMLALMRRFIDEAFESPFRVRELISDPSLRTLNATRNQGLHRATVGREAASRCRRFLMGDAPGRGWLTAALAALSPRPVEELAHRTGWGK